MDSAQSIGWSCQLQDLLLSLLFFCIVLIPTVCPFVSTLNLFIPGDGGSTGNCAAIQLYEYIFCVSLTRVSRRSTPLKCSLVGLQGGWGARRMKIFNAITGLNKYKKNLISHHCLRQKPNAQTMNKLVTLYLRQFKHFRTSS